MFNARQLNLLIKKDKISQGLKCISNDHSCIVLFERIREMFFISLLVLEYSRKAYVTSQYVHRKFAYWKTDLKND